jgi:hypothetical protein
MWQDHLQYDDPDPIFNDFLKAGFCRAVVPARLGFEGAIDEYVREICSLNSPFAFLARPSIPLSMLTPHSHQPFPHFWRALERRSSPSHLQRLVPTDRGRDC